MLRPPFSVLKFINLKTMIMIIDTIHVQYTCVINILIITLTHSKMQGNFKYRYVLTTTKICVYQTKKYRYTTPTQCLHMKDNSTCCCICQFIRQNNKTIFPHNQENVCSDSSSVTMKEFHVWAFSNPFLANWQSFLAFRISSSEVMTKGPTQMINEVTMVTGVTEAGTYSRFFT